MRCIYTASKGKEIDMQPMKGNALTDISDSGDYLFCFVLFFFIIVTRTEVTALARDANHVTHFAKCAYDAILLARDKARIAQETSATGF